MVLRIAIGDLADLLHRSSNSWKGLTLLRVYLDESGIHESSAITAIGGFIGTKDAWTALEPKWNEALEILRPNGVTAFHAYDCQHGGGEYQNCDRALRLPHVERLARIITDHALLPVWSAVINADWHAIVTDEFKQKFPKPVYLCFAYIAERISEWSERQAGRSSVALVYSEQEELETGISDIWKAYRTQKPKANLSSFTTASYRDCIPLQAADLFSYETNCDWRNHEYGIYGNPPPFTYFVRRPFHVIQSKLGVHFGGAYGRDALQRAVREGRP